MKTWKIFGVYRRYCGGAPNPKFQPPRVIKDLSDGTFITESAHRGCFRARYKKCRRRCLPPATRISTPVGEIEVSKLRAGMSVWTRDLAGRKVAATVLEASSVATDRAHRVVVVDLADGRSVGVSVGHPDVDGTDVARLRAGSIYDGAKIRSSETRPYRHSRTFDILPSGATGIYWANGIPLKSTL